MGRSRECVIRAALGASRARLVRQLLVESLLLFAAGAALGMLVAGWSMDALLAFAVAGGYVPERLAVTLDARVLTFGLGLSLVAGVASGIVPAVVASAVDLSAALRASSLTLSGGVRRMRTSRLLIVSEIAVSLVLLVGSGLVVRSFLRLQATSAGIDAENLLMTASDGGRDFPTAVNFWRTALDRTRQLPGVTFAAVTSRPPVHGARGLPFVVDASAAPAGEGRADQARAGDILISADYFRAMGIPLLKGRTFTDRDGAGAMPVAIVSQSLARRYFPDGEALGRRIRLDERSPLTCCSAAAPVDGVWREIVGIVADVRQARLEDAPAMTVYRPYSQIVEHDMFLVARAASPEDAARVAGLLRTHLLAMDPGRVWAAVRPMADVIGGSESIRLRRFALTILGTFAGLALLLSAGGTYGLLAYAVADRTREIGIRVALGATRLVVFRQVLGDALKLTAGGLALGAVAAYLSTRFVASLLFGVSAADPLTWLGAALVLSGIALLAGYAPARRAMRVDPLIALRQD